MKIMKKDEQSLLIKVFGVKDKYYLAASVIIYFDLNDPDKPLTEQDLWTMLPEQLGQGFVLDQGMPKPRGEVLVTGPCFAPRGQTRNASRVSFRVGKLGKALSVFGDRYWKNIAGGAFRISDPVPFSEMPIAYDRAFGGPGFEKNPMGRGITPVIGPDGSTRVPLPNIEYPNRLIGSPGDRTEPAGFGPLDLMWPQRFKKQGTYDDKWQRERWPHFPEDMNYEFFNMAPEDQFIGGFFAGNESIEIANMHPDIPLIQSRLPRVRMRCFILKRTSLKPDEKEEVFLEVSSHIDTVWLFPSILRGVAIYRGTAEVLDDEYADIVRMYFDMERADEEPRSMDFYYQEMQKAFSRAVPIDPAPLEEAKKKIKDAMLLVNNLPKELDAIKKKMLGKAPVMPATPEEAAVQAKMVIQEGMRLVSRMEGMVKGMQAQYAHIVKIDDKVDFNTIRQKLTSADRQIDKTMARAKEGREITAGVQKDISDILKKNIPADLLKKAGVDPDNLLPSGKGVNLWHDHGFPFVVQCRRNLESFGPALESFQKMGFSRKTIRKHWLGINPEERRWDRKAWGLVEKRDQHGNEEFLSLPAGLVIPRFHEAALTRLVIRPSHYSDTRNDILVEGSDAPPLFMAASVMEEDTPCVGVSDDLEAMLVEQEAGDACCVVSLKAASDKPGKDTAGIIERAKVFLIVLTGNEEKRESEWREWSKTYGNAQKLLLPGYGNILEAAKSGFDIRTWIMKALPKDFAEKHAIEPAFPEPGKAPSKPPFKPFAIPQLDIKRLVSGLTGEIKASVQPQVDAAMTMKNEMEKKSKAALLRFGKDEGVIAASVAEQSKKSISEVGDHIVGSLMKTKGKLKTLGVLAPDKEKQIDDAAAQARQMAHEAEARYREGMTQLDSARQAAAKAKAGGIPEFVKEKFKGTGIDPEKIRKLTREEVITMHKEGESLSGVILSEVDLSELDLRGIDLSSAQCQKTKFTNTNLEGAKFDQTLAMEADFSGACLMSAKAEKGIFTKAAFKRTDMREGQFQSSVFTGADWTGASCDRIRLHMSVLKDAKLVKTSFSDADIQMCILSGAEATGAVFRGATLVKCVFMDSSLDNVDFSSATIHSTLFHGAKGKKVTFAGAEMDKARMGGNTTFQQADLRNIRMKHGCFMDSDLSGAAFTGSVIEASLIENCNLRNVQMERVSAKKTRLKGSDLENARMREINLFQSSLRKTRLTGADLRGSNLFGVDMYKATMGNTKLDGANLKMTLLHRREGLVK